MWMKGNKTDIQATTNVPPPIGAAAGALHDPRSAAAPGGDTCSCATCRQSPSIARIASNPRAQLNARKERGDAVDALSTATLCTGGLRDSEFEHMHRRVSCCAPSNHERGAPSAGQYLTSTHCVVEAGLYARRAQCTVRTRLQRCAVCVGKRRFISSLDSNWWLGTCRKCSQKRFTFKRRTCGTRPTT